MWITWNQAAVLALAAGVFALAAERVRNRWATMAAATARELVLVLSVYALWRIAKLQANRKTAEALLHGRWIWEVERTLHLPSELTLQRNVIPHSLLTQACNIFYATVHVPAILAVLIWLFFRHRAHYRWVRNNVAVLTAGCVLIQFIPVAPPRMFPDLGFIDTGLRYGQSVFGPGGSGESNQLAAMPSIHVGWAVLVAVAVVVASSSRWRWLIVLHPALTMYTVMVTGNHWWLDGIVSAAILTASMAVLRAPEAERRREGDNGDEEGHEPSRPGATSAEIHVNA